MLSYKLDGAVYLWKPRPKYHKKTQSIPQTFSPTQFLVHPAPPRIRTFTVACERSEVNTPSPNVESTPHPGCLVLTLHLPIHYLGHTPPRTASLFCLVQRRRVPVRCQLISYIGRRTGLSARPDNYISPCFPSLFGLRNWSVYHPTHSTNSIHHVWRSSSRRHPTLQ